MVRTNKGGEEMEDKRMKHIEESIMRTLRQDIKVYLHDIEENNGVLVIKHSDYELEVNYYIASLIQCLLLQYLDDLNKVLPAGETLEDLWKRRDKDGREKDVRKINSAE